MGPLILKGHMEDLSSEGEEQKNGREPTAEELQRDLPRVDVSFEEKGTDKDRKISIGFGNVKVTDYLRTYAEVRKGRRVSAGFSLMEFGCEERDSEQWLEGTLELRVAFCLFCWRVFWFILL